MREIKFRGLYAGDQDTPSMMVFGSLLYFSDTDCSIVNTDGKEHWAVDPETIGLFTGLLDMNGKEIYEGDIFKSEDYSFTSDGNVNYLGVVLYDEDALAWYYDVERISTRVRGCVCGDRLCELDLSLVEIIGNVHESPEFLELKDD